MVHNSTEKIKASPYQERFWIEWQLDPLSPKYNESFIYEIDGALDLDLLYRALSALSQKHTLLRSCFFKQESGLYIHAAADKNPPFDVVDLPQEQAVDILKLAAQFVDMPFDLRVGPLWRVRVMRIHAKKYWLMIVFRHIMMDGNAYRIFREDLSTFYCQPKTLDELQSIEQCDFNLKKYLEAEQAYISANTANEASLQFYQKQLASHPLHYDDFETISGQDTFVFSLGHSAFKKLKEGTQKQHCSPFQFMSALFAVFLYRYFGQEKFCLNYPVDMRLVDMEDILGSFINMQLLPLHLGSSNSFQDVLVQIRNARRATKKLTTPYEKMIAMLRQQGIINGEGVANVVVSETDLKLESLHLSDLSIKMVPLKKSVLPYDIAFEFELFNDDIHIQLSMKTDGFNQESINQFKQHLIAMIDFACDRPQEQLSALTLSQPFTPDLEFFVEKTRIEEKFDEIAKHFSSQVAFQNADEQTSYAELSKMVHCIAANLAPQTKAIQNFPVVGLSMHHGPELIATMLALFKLGLTYLPIRPDLPPSYIKEIIDQSGLKLIISNNSVSGSLNSGVQILYVEDLLKESKGSFSKIMLENKNKNELAYILYTSGTMGTPKGVMVKHSNITNLISSCQSFYNFSSQDIIPWFHSYAFDFSVWEIWAALLNGATVLLVDEFVAKSPREFTAYIAKYQATFINQTPTALKQWLTYLAAKTDALPDLSKVRVILTGGEALYPHHVSLLLSKKTPLQCKIFNMYGITEDTVHSTIFEVTASYLDQNKSVIGKMLPGKNALIVDRANLIRPVGCPGELVISGFGVANGYLHQVDLTNCKFTQIPEVSPEVVWFKTGDQVRLLPSGHFEYLGREDAQIKIRGYRIDYKDVEARLARLEGVVDVKVVPSDDALIAFLILSPDAVIADIQILAKATLPYYMMPGQFCSVGSIPQTINNKVDEKKLLEITRQSSIVKAGSAEYIDNPVMQKIVEIWHAILPESSFEIEDNFFDCGGNSILLISLQEKLEKTFSIELPIVEFFIHPNVESMTTVVERLISQK